MGGIDRTLSRRCVKLWELCSQNSIANPIGIRTNQQMTMNAALNSTPVFKKKGLQTHLIDDLNTLQCLPCYAFSQNICGNTFQGCRKQSVSLSLPLSTQTTDRASALSGQWWSPPAGESPCLVPSDPPQERVVERRGIAASTSRVAEKLWILWISSISAHLPHLGKRSCPRTYQGPLLETIRVHGTVQPVMINNCPGRSPALAGLGG